MSELQLYPVSDHWSENAWINKEKYEDMYQESVESPDSFWEKQAAEFLDWSVKWEQVYSADFSKGHSTWFLGGKLNVTANCIDRHLDNRGDQTAIIWEGDDPSEHKKISYKELHEHVSKMGNVLRHRNVKKGDRVCIYMPMIPEAAYAMLACARIGAVHSVVFGGFSPEALKDRILDSDCQVIITADEGYRGGKTVPLKENTDKALESCPRVHTCLVIQRTSGDIDWLEGRDVWYHDASNNVSSECHPEIMDSEDPLFILYTSGSTGKPKGVMHTTAGYLLMSAMSHKYTFDYKEGDIYWCTADVGWITGHSYIVYGPLCNGGQHGIVLINLGQAFNIIRSILVDNCTRNGKKFTRRFVFQNLNRGLWHCMIKRYFEIEGTNETIDITRCEQDLAFTINEGTIKSQSEFVKRIQLLEIRERGAGRDRGTVGSDCTERWCINRPSQLR